MVTRSARTPSCTAEDRRSVLTKLVLLAGCILLSTVVIWLRQPDGHSSPRKIAKVLVMALLAGPLLYYVGAIAYVFVWGK